MSSQVSPNSLQQFPLFAEFPKEIRDRIWEHTWPSPGIHFLRLFDPWRHRMKNQIIQGPSWDNNFSLGAPWNESLQRVDWSIGNISMYSVHNTLRTVCRESREAAIRIFRHRGGEDSKEAWTSFGAWLPDEDGDYEDTEERRCFYMHKQLDLLCIQFCDYDHADDTNGWASYAPFWGNGFHMPMIEDMAHVAIEYKPTWDDAFREAVPENFLMGIPLGPEALVSELMGPKWVPYHFPKLRCFYVIDYSITLRHDAQTSSAQPSQVPSREVFFSGGKTFHTVSPEDGLWAVSTLVHKFVAWLEEEYPSTNAIGRGGLTDWGSPPSPPAPGTIQFKVLACADSYLPGPGS